MNFSSKEVFFEKKSTKVSRHVLVIVEASSRNRFEDELHGTPGLEMQNGLKGQGEVALVLAAVHAGHPVGVVHVEVDVDVLGLIPLDPAEVEDIRARPWGRKDARPDVHPSADVGPLDLEGKDSAKVGQQIPVPFQIEGAVTLDVELDRGRFDIHPADPSLLGS